MVVVALEQVAAADVERRRLAAEPRPALVDVDLMAGLSEPERADEAGDPGADHRDPHGSGTRSERSPAGIRRQVDARSRTTYSGRRLTSS